MIRVALQVLFTVLISQMGALTAIAGTTPQDSLREAQKALAAEDYVTSFTLFQRVAEESHDPLADFSLALYYQNGWGRPQDRQAACGHFEKAADGKIPAAAHFFAECLEQGVAQQAAPDKAAIWYEKAASWGHHVSYCSLAKLYMTGTGVPKDPEKALILCSKGATYNTSAQIQMGRYYLEGDAKIRSPQSAYYWFSLAAQKNVAEAQYLLGIMERDGIGRPKSDVNALPWFEVAAAQGYLPAYFPTAELYYSAPVDNQTEKPSANDLAKAYLWLSATIKRSDNKIEKDKAAEMIKNVLAIIPKSWLPSLDEKVDAHIKEESEINNEK